MVAASPSRYMLDANAFDYLLDRSIDPRAVRRLGEICITTVQHHELLDVPDRRRRARLLAVLSAVDPIVRPGFAESPAHDKDAVIGDVAAVEGCVLVTDDKAFRRRAADAGLPALSCAEAFADLDVLEAPPPGSASRPSPDGPRRGRSTRSRAARSRRRR